MVKQFWPLMFLVMAADPAVVINPNPASPGTVTATSVTAGFVDAGIVQTGSLGFSNGATITDPGPGGGPTFTAVDGGLFTLASGSQTATIQVDNSGNIIINNVANATTQFRAAGTPVVSITGAGLSMPSGVITASNGVVIGSGSQIYDQCVSAQGACSMASTTTCTATCTGCTSSSVCFASPYSSAATTDAVGTVAVCATGTVTITAKVGTTGTETFNVTCYN